LVTEATATGQSPVDFERIYAQATDSVHAEARKIHDRADRYREQYRRQLEAWMQLRARIDHRSAARRSGSEVDSFDELRREHDSLGRELGRLQGRLKRLDVAARQLDLVSSYLGSLDPQAEEPSLADADNSPATMRLRIIQAQEAERQRLAEEVHDGPAQVLTNAIFQVEYLDRVLDEKPRSAHGELGFLRTMLRDGLDEIRAFISNLRPPVVDMGLSHAIDRVATEFQQRYGIAVAASVGDIDERVPASAKASVLRIVQESLQNVRKHAAATQVRVVLEGDELVIGDNGRGFDVMRLAANASRNFGLQFMRERAELMGAQLQIESRQGEGTRILLRLPQPQTDSQETSPS
jgi:two-component system sensor histidine kinase DegS